ncbi:hypothetical protein [Chitinophaga rhizophila]|uniref:Uncharacterized protein n=1 Tax=Chitinophaga rhizophila TaxID=2866212 RepID=A0ABS7G7H0_9BACT|nr:hypothetical protein [Chitinophaga rhizophila]MBW8683602.1 hypothetical protein [Chitinophaga rhizophila]
MIETLGIEMKAGRSSNSSKRAGSAEIIFNEAAIKSMGLTDPVGKVVKMLGKDRKIAGIFIYGGNSQLSGREDCAG